MLLKEIHHRVKNNMQVISSLLNIQSRQIGDERAVEMLKETRKRVKSMALIHESLYRSKDLAVIDFVDYIRRLTIHLLQSYNVNPNTIRLKINIEKVFLNINTAIPCGLVINELVSNSLKHAFPEGKRGEICIDLLPEKKGQYFLSVRDNGVGFPKDLDFRKTKSLGMQLVTMLVEQLDGTIKLVRGQGTEFKVSFKELK